jgi:hypothetical protein
MTAPPHSLSPADLLVGIRRRGRPSEDDRDHPPTYWWEPDGAVDLLRMTAPPHHSMRPPTYWWEPDGAVDLLRMTAPPHQKKDLSY